MLIPKDYPKLRKARAAVTRCSLFARDLVRLAGMPAANTADLESLTSQLPQVLRQPAGAWLTSLLEQDANALRDAAAAGIETAALVNMAAVSEFAGRILLRHWPWFIECASDGGLARVPQPDWQSLSQDADEPEFLRQLRVVRNRCLLQILWRKLNSNAELAETLASLSGLADNLIAACDSFVRRQLVARCGDLLDSAGQPMPLIILAMGKLGGRELNFSSDVDLIFLFPEDGESEGPKRLSAQEFFTRLTRRVVNLLEESTADGFVYRVDTRLRPFGDSGPPVVSFAGLESYLLNHGRNWERYAFIKSRVIVPAVRDDHVATLRNELIEPFVYRRYLDYGIFESLRDMKAMITKEVQRREMARNIKLGPGGIREIEFIVQSLQLVRGGSIRGLRSRELGVALNELQKTRGLGRVAGNRLRDAYAFLRRLENFLQGIRDQQVHDLPADAIDQARLALAMGFDDWQGLATETERQRQVVSEQFAAVAFRGESDERTPELRAEFASLCANDASPEEWSAVFAQHDYTDADQLAEAMTAFMQARATKQLDTTASRRLQQLLPDMLSLLRERPQAARSLQRLLNILTQVLRRSAYVALLNENAGALQRLVAVCENSAYLADEIARFPLLLDELLDPGQHSVVQSAESLRDDLSERLAVLGETDSERRVELLSQFQRASLFRIAASDFGGELPIMKVSDRLTDLAEIVLSEALEIAWRDLAERFGEPRFNEDGENRAAGMGVIAYGKLGGIELSYGSDLDLVFLHNSRGDAQLTNGAKAVDNSMFFARLARRLTHFLTTQTGSGALYDVDTRLRPSGRSGLLVTSVEAFERYQRENAWTWEHQALLRARPVAGHAGVARDFERIRTDTLVARVNRETLRHDVVEMRAKMRGQLDKSSKQQFDLKQGTGGIGDIEFLVQFLVLQNAGSHPAVIHYPDNIRQLGTLGRSGCLPRDEVMRLQDIYRSYRLRLHQLLLDEQPPLLPATDFVAEREWIAALWQRILG